MPGKQAGGVGTAQLLVVVLAFCWGLVWFATALALHDVKPWTLRTAGIGGGAATLFIAARIAGIRLHIPRHERIQVVIAGFFTVATFHRRSALAPAVARPGWGEHARRCPDQVKTARR